ncbi:SagB/ThcOx family dehydrogenase [Thermococcus argininiproducens]|uniref:SagB/ThcOx family dehydrogenase n=1 Tax=Thermococcus argininiproducens TaxID=2866384 RepID=A0A9E7MAY3_9EURY|nr:SagB/ThcOx family dehydrogenase [Thermococcus argininiproducens]USH00153.1 SagB/ThcOx family dehydrogenase [Thermococcus argininiproducens]
MELKLPEPKTQGEMSVEETIFKRRSIRRYREESLTLGELSQILWAAYGINAWGKRTSPSAGARYPFEVYVVVSNVEGLTPGFYHYDGKRHVLKLIREGDLRKELVQACLGQKCVATAPVNIVMVAHYERTTSKYGERGIRYVHIDAGHMGQNIYLQATALGLGTVAVGAFRDDEVKRVLDVEGDPLYIFPIGRPAE